MRTIDIYSCQSNLRVDREDYNESSSLWCPLPGCSRMWCKMCMKVLRPGAPNHVCEAAVEFEKLVEQRRWKRCPGACQYPIYHSDLILFSIFILNLRLVVGWPYVS